MEEIKPIKKFAVAFYLIVAEGGIPVYYPVKPMIGYIDESNLVFTDAFTGRRYLHVTKIAGLDEEECFALNGDIDELIKGTNEQSLESALRKLWENIDSRAFIYGSVTKNGDANNFLMYPLADDAYKELFGYSLKDEQLTVEENNSLIDDYMAGAISEEEYAYFLENHEFPKKEKCKIIDFKPKDDPCQPN